MKNATPDIGRNIRAYYFDGGEQPDPLGRYRSWEECFQHFIALRARFPGGIGLDDLAERNAALHLGFYLASWGMFRGSSNLMEHSFLVHIPTVGILLKSEYEFLWQVNPKEILATGLEQKFSASILDLQRRLRKVYEDELKQRNPVSLTDTLLTKILLGTLACTPAYDKFFGSGLAKAGLKSQARLEHSLPEILEFYVDHQGEFDDARSQLKGSGQTYPAMKLLDMYFWQVGKGTS